MFSYACTNQCMLKQLTIDRNDYKALSSLTSFKLPKEIQKQNSVESHIVQEFQKFPLCFIVDPGSFIGEYVSDLSHPAYMANFLANSRKQNNQDSSDDQQKRLTALARLTIGISFKIRDKQRKENFFFEKADNCCIGRHCLGAASACGHADIQSYAEEHFNTYLNPSREKVDKVTLTIDEYSELRSLNSDMLNADHLLRTLCSATGDPSEKVMQLEPEDLLSFFFTGNKVIDEYAARISQNVQIYKENDDARLANMSRIYATQICGLLHTIRCKQRWDNQEHEDREEDFKIAERCRLDIYNTNINVISVRKQLGELYLVGDKIRSYQQIYDE